MTAALSNTVQEDQNFETYCLIWVDASVNDLQENLQAQKQLRTSINHSITFEHDQQCLKYIKLNLGRLGQIIVPEIVQFRQIISIYVYCMNKKTNEQWSQQYSKVKGVFTVLDELINQIKFDQTQRQHLKIDESLSINIFNSNTTSEGHSTSDLNGQFIHSQLLIDCLVSMKSTSTDKNELISFCKKQYKENYSELKIFKEFEQDYLPERALWWYTRQSFLYRLLNKALRVQHIDLLYYFRFFIRDIGQELEKNKCLSPIRVYRAQMMSKEEVEILINSVGEILSMNSFLSTSLDRQRARSFFSMVDDVSNDLKQVFFEIDADPRIENIKSFSNITSLSFFPDEKEILFMVGSIFRLVNIKRDDDGIWIIRMTLCSYNDHHLRSLFEHMKNQLGAGETNRISFGKILKNMGKLDHAEKYFLHLLKQLHNDQEDIAICYFQLGRIADDKADYESSLEWYKKSLEIKIETRKPDDPYIAHNYNNMAIVYKKQGDYASALESYNKALVIWKGAYGENHSDVAACLNNMGSLYQQQKKYSEALEVYQKSLAIREKCLPVDHPHLGDSHINIGCLYSDLNDDNLALEHYNLSLKVYTKSLPPKHPCIATTLQNIGAVYENKNELSKALSYYEKSARIFRHSFASTHPAVVQIEEYIRNVSSKLK